MSSNQILVNLRKYVALGALCLVVGCASTEQSAPLSAAVRQPAGSEITETKRKMEDFLGMTSAFIRRVGQDVSAKGYKVIFTDFGPESLEKDTPDVFRDLAKRSSGGGIQVRGFSQVVVKDGYFRDKQSGEKGVGLLMGGFEEDGQGGRIITGMWSDGPGKEKTEVKYTVIREGTNWKAQPYRPLPKITTAGSKSLLPGLTFIDGPETLSGQLVFQRMDFVKTNGPLHCVSNVVYSFDLQTKTLALVASFGPLNARLIKVADDGQMLCLQDPRSVYLSPPFFVHSIKNRQTKQVRFSNAIDTLGVAFVDKTMFLSSYGAFGPLMQYNFETEKTSEFRPSGLPVEDPEHKPNRPAIPEQGSKNPAFYILDMAILRPIIAGPNPPGKSKSSPVFPTA